MNTHLRTPHKSTPLSWPDPLNLEVPLPPSHITLSPPPWPHRIILTRQATLYAPLNLWQNPDTLLEIVTLERVLILVRKLGYRTFDSLRTQAGGLTPNGERCVFWVSAYPLDARTLRIKLNPEVATVVAVPRWSRQNRLERDYPHLKVLPFELGQLEEEVTETSLHLRRRTVDR